MTSVAVGNSLTYTAVAATQGAPSDTFAYAWAFDDSSTGNTNTLSKSWATTGVHSATVTATDNQTGGSASATKSVSVLGGAASSNTLLTARCWHESILLNNGKVLIVGGLTATSAGGSAIATCELFDPSTGLFTYTGSLNHARGAGFKLIKLTTGDILAIGGRTQNSTNTYWYVSGIDGTMTYCELYSVSTGTWTSVGSMASPRVNIGVALLPSGKVIAIGGASDSSVIYSTSEIYDPVAKTWSSGPSLPYTLAALSVATMPDGSLFVFGGSGSGGMGAELSTYKLIEGGSFTSGSALPADSYGRGLYFPAWSIVGNAMYVTPGLSCSTSGVPNYAYAYSTTGGTWTTNTSAAINGRFSSGGWCATSSGIFLYLGYNSTPQYYNGATVNLNATTLSDGSWASCCYYGPNHVLVTGGSTAFGLTANTQTYIYFIA